jgi:hypothetical protein
MKLSEAILLGDSLRTRTNGCYLNTRTSPPCGCALGGAQLAMGRTEDMAFHELWPWLQDISPDGVSWRAEVGCDNERGFEAVMGGSISIDQLADYVRSIEPSCGECNRFDCTCTTEHKQVESTEAIHA